MKPEAERYFDDWSPDYLTRQKYDQTCWQSMRSAFDETENAAFPPDEAILYASYTYEDYDGNALVLFERDGKLYEVHGGHCSCYGLEGQWKPEETSWAALAMRPYLDEPVKALVASHVQ